MRKPRDIWRQCCNWWTRIEETAPNQLSPAFRRAVRAAALIRVGVRQVTRDRLPVIAGHLTFKTLLGLVPVLVLVLMIISFFWHGGNVGREVRDSILSALNISDIRLNVDGEDIDLASKIDEIVAGAMKNMSAAAAVGIIILFYLSMSVLATIEEEMNRIWRVRTSRPLWRRAILFWLVLTLGPPAIAAAYYVAAQIHHPASHLPESLKVLWGGAVAVVGNCFVLFVMYKLLPNARVRTFAAIAGAVVAGVLWQLIAKTAFDYYIHEAVGYTRMYGNLAVVPIFCLWLYVTWLFILMGCEVAYVVQNYADLARAVAADRRSGESKFLSAEFVGLVAMAAVARRFRKGDGPAPLAFLAAAAGVERVHLEELLGRLEAAGLLVRLTPAAPAEDAEPAWLPARDPQTITLADVIQAARRRLPLPADAVHDDLHRRVREAYERLESDRALSAGRTTVADLAASDSPPAI
jgi:membrane protein